MWAHADPALLELRQNSRITHRVYEFTLVPGTDQMGASFMASQDGPRVVVDVMAERPNVIVELLDAGTSRYVAEITGPWLSKRELALAELLENVVDIATAKRTQDLVDVLVDAMKAASGALTAPIMFAPHSTCVVMLRVPPDETDVSPCKVWVRTEQWVHL